MKKICLLSLGAMLLFGSAASAQTDNTLQFVDANGNVVEDGSVIEGVLENRVDEITGEATPFVDSGLYVRNNSGKDVGANVAFEITRIDNGHLECCFPMNCASASEVGSFATSTASVTANAVKTLQSEWFPDAEGTCTVTYKLQLFDISHNNWGIPVYTKSADGPSVTVNYNYSSTGIAGVDAAEKATVVGYYSLDGCLLSAPQKGINIIKYSNGKDEKIIVR